MVTIVQEKEVDISYGGHGSDAFLSGYTYCRIGPKVRKGLKAFVFKNEAAIAVIGAKIMVVPNGVVGHHSEYGIQSGVGSGLDITRYHPFLAVPVTFSKVDIVSQPNHGIGLGFGDTIENFFTAAV